MKATKRNGTIDLLKFLFSIIVILYHFDNAVRYPDELFTKGYIGVEFFFVTSGFLFAKSLAKYSYGKDTLAQDSVGFMKRKFTSLFPYHVFFFLMTFIYCIIRYGWGIRSTFSQLLSSIPDFLLLRMGGISNLPLLGHEWYVSAMLIVMFILTPVVIKYRKIFLQYICPIMVVGCLGFLYHQKHDLDFVSQWTGVCMAGILRAAAEIAIGCLCYVLCESRLLERLPKAVLLLLEGVLYAVVFLYAVPLFSGLNDYTVLFLVAPAVAVSFTPKASIGFLNNRFVSFLGKLSYPIYLSQIVLRQIIVPINFGLGYAFHAAFYVGCVIIVSLLCILVVDNLLRLCRWFVSRRQPAAN